MNDLSFAQVVILGLGLVALTFILYSVCKNEEKQREQLKDPKYQEKQKMKLEEQYRQRELEFVKRQKMQKELDEKNLAYCPKCLSTSIVLADKKKGSVKRAVVGGALFGSTGAIVGAMTNKNQERVCLKCGHRW